MEALSTANLKANTISQTQGTIFMRVVIICDCIMPEVH